MERESFGCPICSEQFTSVIRFKTHLRSVPHQQQYKKVYPVDEFKRSIHSYTPTIFMNDPNYTPISSRPTLGLSELTLCFCSEERNGFCLCHICEQKFSVPDIVAHLSHVNHYIHYFAHTNPNALSFLSFATDNKLGYSLRNSIKKEHGRTGKGQLQVLHMPERLVTECTKRNYCQVMFFLCQNKSLLNMFKERKLEGMTLQTYKDSSNRTHPLIGLQYIVECICTPHTHLRTYLCTLCSRQLSSSMIIKHVLSFDHVFTFISIWHPSTLKEKECYKRGNADFAKLAHFVKQIEKRHALQEIQQVKLKTSQMLSVLNSYFKRALGEVESIANKGSLIPAVKPGSRSESEPTLPGSSKITKDVKPESTPEPGTSENTAFTQNVKEEIEECTIEHSETPAAPSYCFHCQNCSKNFETDTLYFKHLSTSEHLENLTKTFGAVMDKSSECKPHFHSYKYFTEPDILGVGVSLIVTILSHQLNNEPMHLCFACETVFSRRDIRSHMESERHLIQFLMHQNPWKLPFAWKNRLDYPTLKLKACAEEEERGSIKNINILDVPPCLFPSGTLVRFSDVMEKLDQHSPLLMNGVPQQQTYSKLQDNDGFPILGRDFLVKYGLATSGWKFLCLLCERSLSSDDFTAHVFSWEHVVAFLEKIHPGTLDQNTTNEEMVADFAKQAARIHSISDVQVIEVDTTTSRHSVFLTDHSQKVRLLTTEKERHGKGPLMPSIAPQMKLFPRQQTQQKELNLVLKTTNPERNPENPVEKLGDGVQSTEQVSHEPMDISLPTEQELKTNNTLHPSEPNQSEQMESDQSGSFNSDAMMKTAAASKKQRRESDMDTSDSETEKSEPKRMRLSNINEKEARPNLKNMDAAKRCMSSDTPVHTSGPCYSSGLLSYVQDKRRGPVIGLSALYECVYKDSPPVYLCVCCCLKFKSQHISKHLSEKWHYVRYLQSAGEDPPRSDSKFWINVTKSATYWERREGSGETCVIQLSKEDFNSVEKASYYEALKIVKKCPSRKTSHENVATAATPNMEKASQLSILTQTSDRDQPTAHATFADDVSQSLGSTVTITSATAVLLSSSVSINAKSVTPDESDSTSVEDTNLKMEITTETGSPNSRKPVCKFIKRSVIPEAESKPADTQENAIDEIRDNRSDSCKSIIPKPTIKAVCKFMPFKSANNRSTSAVTQLSSTTTPASKCNADTVTPNTQPTASPLLVDKVTSRTPDVMKEASNPQDASVHPDVVLGKAEPAYLSGVKTTTESSSSQTKLPSAAPTPKTSCTHPKSTGIQLKLNVNAASRVKNDDSALTSGSFSPTTPNFGLLMPTAETSQKSSAPQVGLDQLVRVSCEKKKLVYCLACVTRLARTTHLTTRTHQINSVKIKFPWWSPETSKEELSEMVALLYDNEKALKLDVERIEVPLDIYTDLKLLPDDKAIERIKAMVKRKCSKKTVHRLSISETSNSPCDTSTSPNISGNSRDVPNPDRGNESCPTNPQIKRGDQPLKKIPLPVKAMPVMPAPSLSPPNQKPTSKVAPRIIKGSTTNDLSTLSRILSVKGTSVIGLCLVWECRVIPPKHPTFYLCESCSITISVNDIYEHMKSTNHHFKYLMRKYPVFMYWTEEELEPYMSDHLTDCIAYLVKGREESMDAQTVLLSEEWFTWVQTAPFVEALNVVRKIKQEKKTTSLPPNVAPQQEGDYSLEAEPRDHPAMDTNAYAGTQMSIMEMADGIMETQHEASSEGNLACENTESCSSVTDTNHTSSPQMTQLFDSQSDNVASTNSLQQPDGQTYSPTEQNFAASPKDEIQDQFESDTEACSESETTRPIDLNVSAMSPLGNPIETISLETVIYTSTDSKLKTNIQLCSASVQETSAVSPTHLENDDTKVIDEDQMIEQRSPHGPSDTNVEPTSLEASSIVNQNANEYPAHEAEDKTDEGKAALDKHYYLMLINLLKQTKNSMQQAMSVNKQSPEPCTAKAPESNVEPCKAPQHKGWDIGQSPKTDSDVTDNVYEEVTKNTNGSSTELQISTSNENKEQPTFVNVISVSRDKETSLCEPLIQQSQGQIVQPKDDEPKVRKPLQLVHEEHETMIQESETVKNVLDSQTLLETQVKQTDSQCSSENESQSVGSKQKQELQLKSDTQNISSIPFTHTSHELFKCVQLDIESVPIQTQQAQTQNQELELQPLMSQSQNPSQQTQTQKEQGQSNIAEVEQHTQQFQEQEQSQVGPTQQTQDQTEVVPIYSLISPRQDSAMLFRNDNDYCLQAAPPSFVVTPSEPSSVVFTGDHGQYPQTTYPTNACFSNSLSLPGIHHDYQSHIYQQQQMQQHGPFVQPYLQNFQNSGWFAPNTQQTPGGQNHYSWYTGPVDGMYNVTYSNAMTFNTVNSQSYSYHSVQEYNRVMVQNLFYPSSMPPQTNSQFYPHRQ